MIERRMKFEDYERSFDWSREEQEIFHHSRQGISRGHETKGTASETPNAETLPLPAPYPRPTLPDHVDRSEVKDRPSMFRKSGSSEGLPYRPTSIATGPMGRPKRADAKNWRHAKDTPKRKARHRKAQEWSKRFGGN